MVRMDDWSKIENTLTGIYPEYPQKIKQLGGRREADWQLCASRVFTELELLHAYSSATGMSIPDDSEIGTIEPWPDISVDYLDFHCCIPVGKSNGMLRFLVADPYLCSNILRRSN